MKKEDEGYVRDMLDHARHVVRFMEGVDRERLAEDLLVQYAVIRALTIVGEAARGVSEPYRAAHPGIPWRQIVGMRHILVHNYTEVDLEAVWLAATRDVPDLIPYLERLIAP